MNPGELQPQVQVYLAALRLLLLLRHVMSAAGRGTAGDASPPEPGHPGVEDGRGSWGPRRGTVAAVAVRCVDGAFGAGVAGEPWHGRLAAVSMRVRGPPVLRAVERRRSSGAVVPRTSSSGLPARIRISTAARKWEEAAGEE